MDLRTLYFVGQRVFYVYCGNIIEVKIREIHLQVVDLGKKNLIQIHYNVFNKFFVLKDINEKELFSSKEDLLNALADGEFVVVPFRN
jgi:hypothetical protein